MSEALEGRVPAPLITDRDAAYTLADTEPPAEALRSALLATDTMPPSGRVVVLAGRLGGLARAVARAHPSWLVTSVDPSVALLSASLDALRPAGMTSQLTVMQSHLPELPLLPASADRILGDLPLGHLQSADDLTTWSSAVARALAPGGHIHLRLALAGPSTTEQTAALADLAPAWAALRQASLRGAFPLDQVLTALSRTGLTARVRPGAPPWAHFVEAHR